MNINNTNLQFLQLSVDSGEVLPLVHVGQLTLQLAQSLVQAVVALHQQVGLVGLEELPSFGLGGALQILPALPDLLQLPPDHRAELRLLLDQMLTLLDGGEEHRRSRELLKVRMTRDEHGERKQPRLNTNKAELIYQTLCLNPETINNTTCGGDQVINHLNLKSVSLHSN